jgi:peptide/nickel transport system substrate-binding protein
VVLGGLGVILTGVSALNDGYDDAIAERDYDPDRAEQLLEEAGYGDGFSMELWAPVNGRLPNSEQVVQAVAGYWNEIGVDVQLNIIEYSQWVDKQRNPSDAAGSIFGLWGDAGSFDPQARMIGSLTCDGPYSHICDPQLDSMVESVRSTVDRDERIQAYEDAFQYVFDNAYILYLYTAQGAFAMADDVSWQPWHGTPYTRLANAQPA